MVDGIFVFVKSAVFAGCLTLLSALSAQASNGMIPIGFGVESIAMGGADLAIARDTSAMNSNPAGLTQISNRRIDLVGFAAFALDVGHRDQFGNDVTVANDRIFGGTLAYVSRLGGRPLWWGAGLFLQSASGVEYSHLNTAFGTTDELASLFTVLRLDLSAAYRLNDFISLGGSLGITRNTLEQRIFPGTSAPGPPSKPPFYGTRLDGMVGHGFGPKLGVMVNLSNHSRLGLAYTGRVASTMQDGTLVTNQTVDGRGLVTYRNVKATGMVLPTEIGIGYAVDLTPRLLVSVEADWINWSDALKVTTLTANGPDVTGAPETLSLPGTHNWRDQYVMAIGAAFSPLNDWTVYVGYNHGRNPIPTKNLTPTLATIATDHITAGFRHRLGQHWQLYGALEYTFMADETYNNPALPFGTNAEERLHFVVAHATLSREW